MKIIRETEILFGQNVFEKKRESTSADNRMEHLVGVSESTIKLYIGILVNLKCSS